MSRVIFKMTFKHPNFKDTASKNVSHVNYIATRSGVDKTLTEADLQKELEKGVENLPQSEDETYLRYIDERPRSHGLFGQDGIEDPVDVQKEIADVNSFVWRGIVSIKEDDAKQLGYLEKERWQEMLRKKVPDMAFEMGIRETNIRWVAAVHMEKGHPHAHIMFWEKSPERTLGVVKPKTLDNIRKTFTDEIFEAEKAILLVEKNGMRDLLRDLAKDDVSKATQLLKDIRKSGIELKALHSGVNQEGMVPRLYREEEKLIAEKLQHIAEIMPGKGRVALKFMPENVKEEVRSFADYLLQQPDLAASLEKNLKAVEELTRLYTGKDEDVQRAKDNAYKDIRDRISQVILRGAAESLRSNLFYVDPELSAKAVNFIKSMDNKIDLSFEHSRVLHEIATVLLKTGYDEEQLLKIVSEFAEREYIDFSQESLKELIKNVFTGTSDDVDIEWFSKRKAIEHCLSVLKLIGYDEETAFNVIRETIKKSGSSLTTRLNDLKDKGIVEVVNNSYILTDRGTGELLKVKSLDKSEQEIFKALDKTGDTVSSTTFKDLLDNKEVFSSLRTTNPAEITLGKFDLTLYGVFGEDNRLSLRELEKAIYDKYTDDKLNVDSERASKEFDIYKHRIEKLTLNGYVRFDKETGIYSFGDEAIAELTNLRPQMEFTRYDANVTLNYVEKSDNQILTEEGLKQALNREIVNQTAKDYLERFSDLLESNRYDEYINIDEAGNITATQQGKFLGIELNKLNKYFYQAKGELTEKKLSSMCVKEFGAEQAEQEFKKVLERIDRQVQSGHIEKNQETGTFRIVPVISDLNRLLYQIYKEGGTLNKSALKDVLDKNIPNKDANAQLKYLIKRLDFLKRESYLEGGEKEYKLTVKGIEKRADLLTPQRVLLREKLDYLERLGLVSKAGENYQATDKYYGVVQNICLAKTQGIERTSDLLPKNIAAIIDRTQARVDIGKLERADEKIAMGLYLNEAYKEIKTDYSSVRNYCGVPDSMAKIARNLSTTLLVSGLGLEMTKEILKSWNQNSNSQIEEEKLEEIIEDTAEAVEEDKLWGNTTVISTQEWKETFRSLGVDEKNMPAWIYKGENWQSLNNSLGISHLVNDVWKGVWRELERQRMQTEAQVEMMKKQLNKQQAISQNKQAMKEQARKSKDRNSMYRDDELEQ